MTEFYLQAYPPFSLTRVIRSHGWVQLLPFDSDQEYTVLQTLLRLSTGRIGIVNIEEAQGGVQVRYDGKLEEDEREELEGIVSWMLDLELDLSDFYALARSEPKLAHAAVYARGRILRSPTVFEDVVKTILTTNTTWNGTKRMVKALVDQYGAPLPSNPSRRTFPTARQLAEADVQSLRMDAKLGYRAPYVLELAQRQSSGEIDLEGLKTNQPPTAELRKHLLALKGVGDYAAANLLMLLGHYDYIPVDSWAINMVSKEWYAGAPIGRAEVEAAFEKWGNYKGLAYWLWDWSE